MKTNKTLLWVGIGSALLIGGAVFLYFKNRPKKDEKSDDKSSDDKAAADQAAAEKAAADKAAADKAAADKAAADKAAADKAKANEQPSGFPIKKAIGFNQLAQNLQKGLNSKCFSKLATDKNGNPDGKFGALTEAALMKCYGVKEADFALYNKIIS